MRATTPTPLRALRGALCLASLALVAPALATDDPEAFDAPAAHASFHAFAETWMSQLADDASEELERKRLLRPAAAGSTRLTYRTVASDFEIRLKETGKAGTPYVGILSYVEHRHACSGPAAQSCSRVDSERITEIFPYRGGDWRY